MHTGQSFDFLLTIKDLSSELVTHQMKDDINITYRFSTAYPSRILAESEKYQTILFYTLFFNSYSKNQHKPDLNW